MSAMLSAGWSGSSYVIDMERGVMNRFLVSPVSCGALIGGQLVYQTGMVLLQSLIILGLENRSRNHTASRDSAESCWERASTYV